MNQFFINPLEEEERRCKHHRTLSMLLKDDDSVVAYVVAYKRNDPPSHLLVEVGKCSERKAIAAQKYYINNERSALGGFVVYFERLNGSVVATLERIHERPGINKEEFPRFPLVSKDILMQYAEHFLQIAPTLTSVQGIYLVGSIARGVSQSKDIDLIVVSESCPFQGLEYRLNKHLDPFCFNPTEFGQLSRGGYQITRSMKQLYSRP